MTNVDVVLVMDITSSMFEWIKAAKETLLESFNELKKNYENSTFRIGYVGYRDFSHHSYNDQFVILPLTRDIDSVIQKMNTIIAAGGEDICEDVAGALQHVLDMNWSCKESNDKNKNEDKDIKVVLWVCDAPAHGLKYHSPEVDDRFPKGDPIGREPYQQVKMLAEQGIDMTIFRIDENMDKMIDEFYKAYLSSSSNASYSVLNLVFTKIDSGNAGIYGLPPWAGWIDLETYDNEPERYYLNNRGRVDDIRNRNRGYLSRGRKSRCGFYIDIDYDRYITRKRGETIYQKTEYSTSLVPSISHIMKNATTEIVSDSIQRKR